MLEWKRQGYRSREHAEGTEMQKRYDRYSKKINNLRRVLKASLLQKAIQDFHTNVHVDEVNRQLRGIRPADVISPPNKEYRFASDAKALVVGQRKEAANKRSRGVSALTARKEPMDMAVRKIFRNWNHLENQVSLWWICRRVQDQCAHFVDGKAAMEGANGLKHGD
ncbi:uncharacterized protein HRG_11912 [Hirsutella rhossiliensis]|uniref:Uncharacterized protein n=1 Tax=Hirsutella rhossiliensis TaxID=111463 RepID=A0A9P8MKW4_9HYPO|nr:uncharacterized protein HRG_11912 [Hirsutella rhossiliensis]KAH0957010.1 hypothetical protein HRG_11912 [Hirsutella rhossiliensis]